MNSALMKEAAGVGQRRSPRRAITSNGTPSANQAQASPQLSDTNAETNPLAVRTPSTKGQPHSLSRGWSARWVG